MVLQTKHKVIIGLVVFILLVTAGAVGTYKYFVSTLPKLITLADYEPLLSTQVFDRNDKKIGEFFHERRELVPYSKIPKDLVNAFLSAEDNQFFQHSGVNFLAIFRAQLANMRAGHYVQGGSTITQQVAKTMMLTNEKTITRKIKDILLAQELELHLKKEDILYLYLNQIYFGQSAHGIQLAAQTYFRKDVSQLTLPEMAMLAGLPKAPSEYSPIKNPSRSKERQVYVLHRMVEDGHITAAVAEKAIKEPVKIYTKENYEALAPYFLETVRQMLTAQLGEDAVFDQGLRVYTSLDLPKQLVAQEAVINNLKDLDKRQGYRGALRHIDDPKEQTDFFVKTRSHLIAESNPERIILPEGKFAEPAPFDPQYDVKKGIPSYIKIGESAEGLVTGIDDLTGAVSVKCAEMDGIIEFDTMRWARKPNSEKRHDLDQIRKPSQALKVGDVILVKLMGLTSNAAKLAKIRTANPPPVRQYFSFELDQEPIAQASLLSLDQNTQEVLAMIGGTDFEKSKYNRTLQAARQTGSSFKAIVYTSALDHGYNPATPIMDAPLIFDESKEGDTEGQEDEKVWRPSNHMKSFSGDIIVRNALAQSLNVPAVKVIEDIKVNWVADYAKRLGIFSKLNMDFTMALGSSSVTLYEMTKVFSEIGRLGKRMRPLLIKRVEDPKGQKVLDQVGLDLRFEKQMDPIDKEFEERRQLFLASHSQTPTESAKPKDAGADDKSGTADNKSGTADEKPAPEAAAKNKVQKTDEFLFFPDPEQLIRPTTAYLMISLLKAVVEDKHGTGGAARALGRDVFAKTGTSNGYYDAWFMGVTPQIATGVWVGFDQEKSLGKGEVGGRAALPIWLDYMRFAHQDLPQTNFPVPDGIVFANIEADTGKLASSNSKNVVRQAFLESTEPSAHRDGKEEDTDFYKQDFSE